MTTIFRLVLLASLLGVAACSGDELTRTFGLTRDAPDEFQVTTRAPLSMPPDFTLRPPRPGAARPQELSAAAAGRGGAVARHADGERPGRAHAGPGGARRRRRPPGAGRHPRPRGPRGRARPAQPQLRRPADVLEARRRRRAPWSTRCARASACARTPHSARRRIPATRRSSSARVREAGSATCSSHGAGPAADDPAGELHRGAEAGGWRVRGVARAPGIRAVRGDAAFAAAHGRWRRRSASICATTPGSAPRSRSSRSWSSPGTGRRIMSGTSMPRSPPRPASAPAIIEAIRDGRRPDGDERGRGDRLRFLDRTAADQAGVGRDLGAGGAAVRQGGRRRSGRDQRLLLAAGDAAERGALFLLPPDGTKLPRFPD